MSARRASSSGPPSLSSSSLARESRRAEDWRVELEAVIRRIRSAMESCWFSASSASLAAARAAAAAAAAESKSM